MVAHKKKDNIYWLLPGGGVNYGENLPQALAREFVEELGIIIQPGDIIYCSESISPCGKRHIINIIFECTFISGDYKLGNDKRLHNYSFFSHDEITNLTIYPAMNSVICNILQNNKPEIIYHKTGWI